MTWRYILYESNKIGKEINYIDNTLIFEGEYLKWKRHGKGKEYNKYCKLIFEEEYLNGQKNGKGREFYCGGNLSFEIIGKLAFEGEYFNNKKLNGIG